MNTGSEAITVEELSYTYPDGTVALQSLSFRIHVGECFGLIGPNGAGKSTLLLLLNGVIEGPGRVWLLGQRLALFNEQKLPRRMSMVFENPDDQLFMSTVFDDVAFGAVNLGLDDNTVRQRVQAALEAAGMEDFAARPPYHLSLDEKKRVALATVLVMDCEIIALDEPTNGLDPAGREEFIQLLGDVWILFLRRFQFLSVAFKRVDLGLEFTQGAELALVEGESAIFAVESIEKAIQLLQQDTLQPKAVQAIVGVGSRLTAVGGACG